MLQNGLMQRDLLRENPLSPSLLLLLFATLFFSATDYSSSIGEPPRFYFVSDFTPYKPSDGITFGDYVFSAFLNHKSVRCLFRKTRTGETILCNE